MNSVDPRCEDYFRGDDSHGLALEIGRDAFDDGGVVEETLLADANVGGKAGL